MQKRQATFECRKNFLLIVVGVLTLALSTAFGLVSATPRSSQQQSQAQTVPAVPPSIVFQYEVASIKLNKSGSGDIDSTSMPDSFTIKNAPLKTLIESAYAVQNYQISGASDWLTSERYDIDAKMDPSLVDGFQKLSLIDRRLARQQMLQLLLADRFALKIHRETKELPVFLLVFAKSGSKLQVTKSPDSNPNALGPPSSRGGASFRSSSKGSGPLTVTALHCSTADIASYLTTRVGRPILDKTGLTDRYDFTLEFAQDDMSSQASSGGAASGSAPAASSDPVGASVFTAIQQQLGLKLEPGKGPVEIVVIDHVERPSGN
jgi:uncharacterized protein (TIGR03435 family)